MNSSNYASEADDLNWAPISNILLVNYIQLAFLYADKLSKNGICGDRKQVLDKLFEARFKSVLFDASPTYTEPTTDRDFVEWLDDAIRFITDQHSIVTNNDDDFFGSSEEIENEPNYRDLDFLQQFENDSSRLASLGLDAYATYRPIHFFADARGFSTNWGIYISELGVLRLAAKLHEMFVFDSRFGQPAPPKNHLFIEMAFQILLRHELGHFKFESFALNAEMLTQRALYVPYLVNVYAEAYDSIDCLEEAIANAMVLNSVKINKIFNTIYPEKVEKEVDVSWKWREIVSNVFDRQPECYRNYRLDRGPHQTLNNYYSGLLGDRQRATNYLCNQIVSGNCHPNENIPFYAYPPENYFLRAENLVPIHLVKSLNPDDWFLLGAPPKTKDFEKFLRELGFEKFAGDGKGSHSKWRRNGFVGFLTIPFGKELSIGVFKQQLRQLSDLGVTESYFREFMQTKRLPQRF